MQIDTPKIETLAAAAERPVVQLRFAGEPDEREVDLAGWIATGGDILAALKDPGVFAGARVADYGRAVEWGETGGDLAIDAVHLHALAEEQKAFGSADLALWQKSAGLSNTEAAEFFDVGRSTYLSYKAGASKVPPAVAMVCRASTRDPLILQAHFRPAAPAGRPRNPLAAALEDLGDKLAHTAEKGRARRREGNERLGQAMRQLSGALAEDADAMRARKASRGTKS